MLKSRFLPLVLSSLLIMTQTTFAQTFKYPFQNPTLTIEQRVDDLISHMTLEEKSAQLMYGTPAIERLGVPQYNWWNECLHGVARNGRATIFPQAIGMAAAWDTRLPTATATAIRV